MHIAHLVFYQCYDQWIQLNSPEKQVYSEWEAILTFLCHLSTINQTITILPWKTVDQQQEYHLVKSVMTSLATSLTHKCISLA